MADFYKVSNSMRAKDRDGNPKSWESQYGTFEVWNVYFEDDDVKYQMNKKPGFSGYERGQEIYGTKTQGQYGGQFKQEQAPEGTAPSVQRQPQQSSGGSVDSKLDYIISLLENLSNFPGNDSGATASSQAVPTDIDDGPVDLSALDY